MVKAKRGDFVYSRYFGGWLEVVDILSDGYFMFRTDIWSAPQKSRTPISYFEQRNLVMKAP